MDVNPTLYLREAVRRVSGCVQTPLSETGGLGEYFGIGCGCGDLRVGWYPLQVRHSNFTPLRNGLKGH